MTGPRLVRGSEIVLALLALALCSCAQSEPPPGPGPGRRIPRLAYESLDADGSASVDRQEFEALATALFQQLDTDRDGRLTKTEYEQLWARPAEIGRAHV